MKFGIGSTPPSRQRSAEFLLSCGLTLAEERTLGDEAVGKRAWGGFAIGVVDSASPGTTNGLDVSMNAGQTKTERLRWFHWVGLSACSAGMLMIGVLEVMQGADPTSRVFAVDTVIVRILGAALALCALWLPLRHDRAFVASMWLLGLTIVENIITYRFEAFSVAESAGVLVTVAILLGAPLFILAELRPVFRANSADPRH